jgi:hypothetical protein
MTKPDDSHIDEMREALRGDRERSRRSSVVSQQLAGDEQRDDPGPAERAPSALWRFLFWRR